MQGVAKTVYEGLMVLLVMLTIATIWTENTYNSTINWIVWLVFAVDFMVRLVLADKKWDFIKQNPFLLIAVIPLDQFFQMARIVRLLSLFRIKTITKYYVTPYINKLSSRTKFVGLAGIVLFLLVEGLVVWQTETTILSYAEGLFAVISHMLFFGHRLFTIEHALSIWLLTAASVIGIVIQGLVLQWGFHRVETVYQEWKGKKEAS
ncbi:transporter [Lentibacillus sediminis]|uniref:transporter n=1 Tax=Lentibacillus sediminis TaxID=1940529 RepID=UPI000C1BA423|nr:transporter [Lentibacillus sediminis]